MLAAIDIAKLFEGMNVWRLAALAGGAIILLQVFNIKDFSSMPIIGSLLKAIGIVKETEPVVPLPAGYVVPADSQTVQDRAAELQQAHDAIELRCQKLALELRDLRHFAAEQPSDVAVGMLAACDTLAATLEAYHKSHTDRVARS
jgi:hypothetical protein